MNNHSIPSMHAERQITNLSVKHSFTLYPSLSPHLQTDGLTDRESNTLASRGLEEPFFQFCCCVVLVFDSGGNKVLIYIRMYFLEYNTVVVVC